MVKKICKNNICLFKKNWVKKLFGKQNLGNKKILGQKISGPKSQKKFSGLKLFCVKKNFWVKKKLCQKSFWVKKICLVEKIFG